MVTDTESDLIVVEGDLDDSVSLLYSDQEEMDSDSVIGVTDSVVLDDSSVNLVVEVSSVVSFVKEDDGVVP